MSNNQPDISSDVDSPRQQDPNHPFSNAKVERKMGKLAALHAQQTQNCGNIQESANKRMDQIKSMDTAKKQVEDLTAKVNQLTLKAEMSDTKQRQLERKNEELGEQLNLEVTRIEKLMADETKRVDVRCAKQDQAWLDQAEKIKNIIAAKEKKINLNIDGKVDNEASNRHLMEKELDGLSKTVRDLKASLGEEVAKLLASLDRSNKKAKEEIRETVTLLTAERTTRDRGMTSVKNESKANVAELKNLMDSKNKELSKEMKGISNQLTFMLDSLNSDLKNNIRQRDSLIQKTEENFEVKVDTLARNTEAKLKDLREQTDYMFNQSKDMTQTVKDDLDSESDERKNDRKQLDAQLLQEHTIRESDEAAIIAMLETFMKQVRNMQH